MSRDLTAIVETVCASEWKRQKYAHGQQWDDLDSLVQHNAREVLLPIVKATLDALDATEPADVHTFRLAWGRVEALSWELSPEVGPLIRAALRGEQP